MSSSPIEVTVVRPKPSDTAVVGRFFGKLAGLFLNAWLIMLIVGAQTPWHPGYWQTVLLLIAVQMIFPAATTSTYPYWTKEPK